MESVFSLEAHLGSLRSTGAWSDRKRASDRPGAMCTVLLQIDSSPIFGAPLDSGARRPGET